MIRKFIVTVLAVVLAYVLLIQFKMWRHARRDAHSGLKGPSPAAAETAQRIYSFSFSKYTSGGAKELEIEGDSADILSREVALLNVIAKAYAEESPVTITADQGTFDKSTSDVHLRKNVVATTENGARLITESLNIHPNAKRMETEIAAKVKKDNIDVEGMGASSDSELRKVTFKKNVTVVVQDPESESKTPTVITSDGPLEIDYKRNIAHFARNVTARDARGTLTADYMDVYYDGDSRRVSKMIARGNVVIVGREGNTTYSDNAIYLADEGRIILGGDVEAEYRAEGGIL